MYSSVSWPHYVLIFIAIKNVLGAGSTYKKFIIIRFSEPFFPKKKRFFSGRFSISVIFEGSRLNVNTHHGKVEII